MPEVPPRDRAGPRPAVDGDGRVANARAPGGERARRVRGGRRSAERRRGRGAARRQRPPPAPHLLRRARRDAAAVPADAPPAARQAAPHRHADAGRADRADERLSQPAPLQRGVRRRLSHEPDAAARGAAPRSAAGAVRGGTHRPGERRRDHGDARLPRAARRRHPARLHRPARDPRHREHRRGFDPADGPRRCRRRAMPAGSRRASCRRKHASSCRSRRRSGR